VLLIAAAVFGLLAAYHMLVAIYQFSPVEAAAIMAVVVVAILPLVGRQPKRASPAPLTTTGASAGLIDQGVGKAIEQVGPVPLVASLSSLGRS
jgi:hypothetical protein